MSNRKIHNLFTDTLVAGLTDPLTGELETVVLKPQMLLNKTIERDFDNVNRLIVSLIPAPSDTQTLNGDHKRFTGIYQIDVQVFKDTDDSDVDDMLYSIQEKLQSIFEVDMLLTASDGFAVQVISPLKTSEARMFKQWWTCHCYFNYRADTN